MEPNCAQSVVVTVSKEGLARRAAGQPVMFRCSPEFRARVERQAARLEKSLSDLVRDAVREHLERLEGAERETLSLNDQAGDYGRGAKGD